jgi:DNA modification methylase
VRIIEGDCIEQMRQMDEASVDAIVTDPPYSLSFMGKAWDTHGVGEDAAEGYWLAGLVDGEGHFAIKRASKGNYSCSFEMGMRLDDRATLERAKRFLGVGSISDRPARGSHNPMAVLSVDAKADCLRVVEVFARYPLRSKKLRDFLAWAEAAVEWNEMKVGHRWSGRADWSRLAALKRSVERAREYREPPWSGHPHQDASREWAEEVLRVLKPGGHLLAFGGTRTYHRLACAVEDAGFEIRDSLIWLYGSGFPKSLDVSKAIDKRRDWTLVERLATEIRRAREEMGWSLKETGERMKAATDGQYGEWYCRGGHMFFETGRSLPSRPEWEHLRTLLPIAAEFQATYDEAEREKTGEATGAQAESTGRYGGWGNDEDGDGISTYDLTTPATPEATQWEGWGTALKPGHEPIVVARKPLSGTVAQNVLEHGTGALNIDGCRLDGIPGGDPERFQSMLGSHIYAQDKWTKENMRGRTMDQTRGRWPANVALSHLPECEQVGERNVKTSDPRRADGSVNAAWGTKGIYGGASSEGMEKPRYTEDGTETVPAYSCAPGCPVAALDEQSGDLSSSRANGNPNNPKHGQQHVKSSYGWGYESESVDYRDRGGASRFFYTAKASRGERNAGLEGFDPKVRGNLAQGMQNMPLDGSGNPTTRTTETRNSHPTVKPIDLMRWLVRLVTPPGGTVLDSFAGSGTTGIAAALEGFDFIGIEREAEYVEIAKARIAWWEPHAGRDTEDVLLEAGLSERLHREHREAGQLDLLGGDGLGAFEPNRSVYGFKSTKTLARCPDHDASLPSGQNVYACGCAIQYSSAGPISETEP